MEQERIGSWMQTFTGKQFFPLDPDPEIIDIKDIAHSLSLTCRYAGHVTEFYSVAEHSIHLSHYVLEKHAMWALMHDAAETYVGDMVRPLKQNIPQYKEVENRLLLMIARKFELINWFDGIPEEVMDADNRILLDEKNQIMTKSPEPWYQEGRVLPLGIDLHCWDPWTAEERFLARFEELGGKL